jgi:superfamily II DNA or RNA helicase
MTVLKTPNQIKEDLDLSSKAIQETGVKDFSIAPEHFSTETFHKPDADLNYSVRRELFVDILKNSNIPEVKRGKETALSINLDPSLQEKIAYVESLNRLDRYVNETIAAEQKILREHQIDVFQDIRTTLEQGVKSGFIKLPTGAGKTAIFCEMAEVLGLKTLVVVPTKDLLLQTRDQMRKFATTIPQDQIALYYSDQKDAQKQINITTYDSLTSNFAGKLISPGDFDLVILDEAHLALGPRRAAVIEALKEDSIVLGFTATPEYHADKTLDSLLGHKIHSLDATAAIKRGILSPVSAVAVKIEADLSKVKISAEGNYDEHELQRAINTESVNQGAIKVMQSVFEGKRAIAFCAGIEHAENLARSMQKAGLKADFVHGNDPDREQKIESLKSGKIDILCNADLLIAGFDCPAVSVCLNLAPTSSKVRAEQRGGRATRLDPDNSDKHGVVVDFIYADSRSQFVPVLYSDVLNGQLVVTPTAESETVDRPEWLTRGTAKLQAEGVEVILTIDELAKVLPRNIATTKDTNAIAIEQGWTKVEICDELKITGGRFESIIDELGDKLNGQIQKVRSNGHLKYIYSDEAFIAIKETVCTLPVAPEGWITTSEAKLTLNLSRETMSQLIPTLREHGHIKEFYALHYHRSLNYISPEGQKMILDTLGKAAPSGWTREDPVKGNWDDRSKYRAKIIESLLEQGFEHGYFRNGKVQNVLYISPRTTLETDKLVRERFSVTGLMRELGAPEELVRKEAKALKLRSPEMFELDTSLVKRPTTLAEKDAWLKRPLSYSDEYLNTSGYILLKNMLCNKLPAAPGWKTPAEIHYSGRHVEKEANKLLNTVDFSSEDVRDYISSKGVIIAHYSPALSEAILASLKELPKK